MRDWLTKDLGWKAFSVTLAVVVWVTVHKSQNESTAKSRDITYGDLPVMAVSLPAGAQALIVPSNVTVTVSGPSDVMEKLKENEICPQVNLNGVELGRDWPRPVEVAVPQGVSVVNVDPQDHVTVTLTLPAQTNQIEKHE